MPSIEITPKTKKRQFLTDGFVPNSKLPVVIYSEAVRFGHRVNGVDKEALRLLTAQHKWVLEWDDNIYKTQHYHSTAHECLIVYAGSATVLVGGKRIGEKIRVAKGDVLVLPAGVAHQKTSSSKDFGVFGLYPKNQKWDLLRGTRTELENARRNIAKVRLPEEDPLYGKTGPLVTYWKLSQD